MSAERPDEYIGRTLDKRYHVRRLIGRGGMGAVYEADHVGLGKRVAIKFLLARDDAAMVARFRREAQAASKIEHDHVVQIFDVGTDETGVDFIVMEYVEGPDLKRVLDAGPLPVERALHIGMQLLRGLQAIHDGRILHRDIKPANIVLETHEGDPDFVKIMDFGISKSVTPGSDAITQSGQMIGTPQYMAPEQLTGDQGDARSDLYAAALTIYEMIAGAPPFKGGNTAQIIGMHLGAQPRPLDQVQPEVPVHVAMAIDRALDKSPSARFDSADQFAAALASSDGQRRISHGRLDGSTQPAAPAPSSQNAATKPISKPLSPAAREAATRPLSSPGPSVAMPQSADHRNASTAATRRELAAPVPAAPVRRPMWPYAVAGVLVIGVPLAVYFAMHEPAHHAAVPRDAAVVVIAADAAASVDAATLVTVDVPVDAGAGSASAELPGRDTKNAGLYCHCLYPGHVDFICKKKTTPLCRCEAGQVPLCETKPFTSCNAPFALPATSRGNQCQGYISGAGSVVPGAIRCHQCPYEAPLFRGKPGDVCNGFSAADGRPQSGVLGKCQKQP